MVQLVVLINLESLNADLIRQNRSAKERLIKLRQIAYYQLEALTGTKIANRLQIGVLSSDDN